MKLHLIGQDLQDYQDSFGLIKQYLVHPVDPVKKGNSGAIKFLLRSNWPFLGPAAALDSGFRRNDGRDPTGSRHAGLDPASSRLVFPGKSLRLGRNKEMR